MKAERRDEMRKVRLAPIVASVTAATLAILILHYCVAPVSYIAVKEACNREGGQHISESAYVDGFWHAPSTDDMDCDGCKGQVARQDFSFVEFGPIAARKTDAKKFVRFELAQSGSANCLPRGNFETPPAGMCVAETALSAAPQSRYFVQTSLRREERKYGVELRVRRRSVYDRVEKKVIATFSYFEAATPADRSGNFAWSYNCGAPPAINPFDDDAFIKRVLRDESVANQRSSSK
jgi:hypothetical protein